jgi:tetratricopeptide (TPR) repeat protein
MTRSHLHRTRMLERCRELAVAGIVLSGLQLAAAARASAQEVLGKVDFRVSCSAPAQAEFNRAVALLHHMTYPRAREAFANVARIDPDCAMAHWGTAMTLFQPLWPTRPGPQELQRGWQAAQAALSSRALTERERFLAGAVAAFFQNPESSDYWQRIRRWEVAMADAHRAYPRDHEVIAFYALSHLAAAASDDKSVSEHAERAADLLAAVYAENPEHPGAMHYLVHASDVSGRERASLDVTQKYENAAPKNPHALHMPTHIYTRLGEWNGVVRGNLLAADAALANPAGDQGQFIWDEFPHAIEYVVYAYLQQGADDLAEAQLDRLHNTAALEPTFKTAFHLASTRARYALERKNWPEGMSLVPREPRTLDWDRFTWPEAITWFAKGLGAARLNRVADARAALQVLADLQSKATNAGEELFARNIQILVLELNAWIAHDEGDVAASQSFMREAAALELATPKHAVTPAPTLPAHELWGDLYLAQQQPEEALRAYRQSLELYPNRLNSVAGAAQAAVANRDWATAREYYQCLLTLAAASSTREAVSEARRFVSTRR